MPSKLFVVNQALLEIGRPTVTAYTDSDDATLLWNKLDILLPELLLAYTWNFAIVYVKDNTPLTTNFSPQYNYTFQLPADYGRMALFVNPQFSYQVVDGLILANYQPIEYYYVSLNTSYGSLPVPFVRALSIYAAADSCAVLTNNVNLTQFLYKKYEDKLADAIQINDQERRIISKPYNDFDRMQII